MGEEKERKNKTEEMELEKKGEVEAENESLRECIETIRKLEEEKERLEKENAELLNKYLRKLADFDNYKKRLEKEKQEYYIYALADFLRELLPIVDNFERALSATEGDFETFKMGVELIYKQLMNLLAKEGVKEVEIGEEFDPNVAQAIDKEESEEVEEPKVAQVLQKGYFLADRLLRPALVKVLVPAKKEKEEDGRNGGN